MSADNGIYILRTVRNFKEEPKGCWQKGEKHYVWRVAHASAIDNFDWYEENDIVNLGAYMRDIWGLSPVFLCIEDALKEAYKYTQMLGILEYGIQFIDTEYVFYGDM